VGALLLRPLGMGSGINMELMSNAAEAAMQGWSAMMEAFNHVNLFMVCVELLLGCLITCTFMWLCTYSLVMLLMRRR
jgi:hypothetical protein